MWPRCLRRNRVEKLGRKVLGTPVRIGSGHAYVQASLEVSPKDMEEGKESQARHSALDVLVWQAKAGMYFPLWKLALVALPQLGVQVTWCFIGPNAAPYMSHLGVGDSLATLPLGRHVSSHVMATGTTSQGPSPASSPAH